MHNVVDLEYGLENGIIANHGSGVGWVGLCFLFLGFTTTYGQARLLCFYYE
jgi:hypothetical protein